MALNEMSWRGSQDDLWILANWQPLQIRELYCDREYWGEDALNWESIRQYRKKHKHELGAWRGMEKPTPFENLDNERERVKRVRKNAPKVGDAALKMANIQVPEEHKVYHEKLQEALDSEGRVERATFREGSHQGFIKNTDGEIEYTDELPNKRMEFSISFDTEPKWEPVRRISAGALPKRERAESDKVRESKKAVIIPDLQMPHHDEKALSVALEIIRDTKPDKIIILGDLLDLSAFSRFEQRREYAEETNEALMQAYQLLRQLRKENRESEIVVIEGNHDRRLEKSNLVNWAASHGIKKPADVLQGLSEGVMTIPSLLSFNEMDIEYSAGYPANRYWINKNLQVRHGSLARKGNTAVVMAQEERISTIFGHIHRLETQYLTHHTYDGGKTIGAWSVGCLCKIDGSVPSTKSGVDLSGRPVLNYENWTQGLAVVTYEDGDGAFDVQPVYVNTFLNYATYYGGKKYEAST